MLINKELQCVLNILNKEDLSIPNDIDYDRFTALLIRHRVYPLYEEYIHKYDLTISNELQRSINNNKLKTLQLIQETIRLNKVFNEHGINLVFIKGVVLAKDLYQDINLRPAKDIDFIVSEKYIIQTIKILEELGYELKYPEFELTPRRIKYFIKNKIEFVFVHKITKLCIEPHWGLNYFSNKCSYQTTTVQFYNQELKTLTEIDNFIYLSLHGATHCFWRLRWLNDLALLIRKGISLDAVLQKAKAQNVLPIIHMALILVQKFFTIHYTQNIEHTITQDKKAKRLAKIAIQYILTEDYTFDGNTHHKLFYLYRVYLYYICPSLIDKLKQIKQDIFKLDNTIRDINLDDKYWYLYYFLHPILIIKRIIQGK